MMAAAGMPQPDPGGGAQAPMAPIRWAGLSLVGADGRSQQPQQGAEAAPGMPDGATVYPEKGGGMPTEGVPQELQSPMNAMQQQPGTGVNVLYLAKRAATEIGKMQEGEKYTELLKMKGSNPQLYTLVLQILQSGKGSQRDNLNPTQMPLPQQKPPRRQISLA
jgi:hypothetical protein